MQSLQKPLTLSEIKLRALGNEHPARSVRCCCYRIEITFDLQHCTCASATCNVRGIHESRNKWLAYAWSISTPSITHSPLLQSSSHEDAASFISSPYPPGRSHAGFGLCRVARTCPRHMAESDIHVPRCPVYRTLWRVQILQRSIMLSIFVNRR